MWSASTLLSPGGPSAEPQALAYFPMDQWSVGFVTFVARVHGSSEPYLAVCPDALRQLDPHVPVYDVKTLDQRLSANLKQPRFYTTVILFFGGFALLLALIGIYGVATYSIAHRAHEIGVRMAVGARFAQIRLMLMQQSLLPLIMGLSVGVAGSFALRGYLQALIYNAAALDGLTCAGAALLLALAATIAVWFATRRILKLDPCVPSALNRSIPGTRRESSSLFVRYERQRRKAPTPSAGSSRDASSMKETLASVCLALVTSRSGSEALRARHFPCRRYDQESRAPGLPRPALRAAARLPARR